MKYINDNWKDQVCIVMPCYNEDRVIRSTLRTLKRAGFRNIIVVDDGSKDNSGKIAKSEGAKVYRHIINRGLGAALGTGIQAATETDCRVIVTYDSDGQHIPSYVEKAVKPIIQGKADAVIGSRLINPKGMPPIRVFGNWLFNCITYVLFGTWTTDSQSGLRAFSKNAAKKINIKTNRMEVSSEIIKEIGRNKLKFKEVPIKAIYTDYSMMKGQSNLNAFNITFKLFFKRLLGR